MSKEKCPKGKIKRIAYTKKNGIKVKSACITDQGKPGKGPKVLPALKKGNLQQFGYRNVKNMSVNQRHVALRKAIKKFGKRQVEKMLTVVATYHKNTNPVISTIFKEDAVWVKMRK